MRRTFPNLVLWILLACGVATLPLACADDDNGGTDAAPKADTAGERGPDSMTGA